MMQAEEMQFLNTLATEIETNKIQLPSFPDAVIKIRNALEREDCDIQKIASLASAETALASRLLQTANSTFYNPAGKPVTDLGAAVMRLGTKEVRNLAITLAVEQIFLAKDQSTIANSLAKLWRRSVRISSVAYVIAKHCAKKHVDAEKAFLCGLLHDVGKLYMLTKATQFPGITVDLDASSDAAGSWHPQVGKAIAEGWGFADDIVRTLTPVDEVAQGGGAMEPDLIDVVFTAERICSETAEAPLNYDEVFIRRLGLTEEMLAELQPVIQERMNSMAQSLKG